MESGIEIYRGRQMSGSVVYREEHGQISFDYEVGMDLSCGISAPSTFDWDLKYPWAQGRREAILEAIAAEFIRREFPSHHVRITDLFIWILPQEL